MPNTAPKKLSQCNDTQTQNAFIKTAYRLYEALKAEIEAGGSAPSKALDEKKEAASMLLELVHFLNTHSSGVYEEAYYAQKEDDEHDGKSDFAWPTLLDKMTNLKKGFELVFESRVFQDAFISAETRANVDKSKLL